MSDADDRYNHSDKGRARWLAYYHRNAVDINHAKVRRDRAAASARDQATMATIREALGAPRDASVADVVAHIVGGA